MSPLAYYREWTEAEIAYAAEKWLEGVTLDDIASGLSSSLGFLTSRKVIARIMRMNADRFPKRVRPQPVRRAPRNRQVADARKRAPVRKALVERCNAIVTLWAQGIAAPIIAERASCSTNYVLAYVRENPDLCPPRVPETASQDVQPVQALAEFGIGKRTRWVQPMGGGIAYDMPAKAPVSLPAIWEARA